MVMISMIFEKAVLSSKEINEILPHRYPFSFVQGVTIDTEYTGVGIAIWPSGHIIFDGHFPEFPIVPGVCLVEAAAQVAGVIIGHSLDQADREEGIGVLAGIEKFVISKPVLPNDQVHISLKIKRMHPRMNIVYAKGRVQGEEVFSAQLLLGGISRDQLQRMMSHA